MLWVHRLSQEAAGVSVESISDGVSVSLVSMSVVGSAAMFDMFVVWWTIQEAYVMSVACRACCCWLPIAVDNLCTRPI